MQDAAGPYADSRRVAISDGGIESLMALLVASPDKRVMQAAIDGENVWIKRYELSHVTWAKSLHGVASPLLRPSFLKSSPLLSPSGKVDRELRKAEAFRRAGYRVPGIVYRHGSVLVLKDAAPTLEQYLKDLRRRGEAAATAHDGALVEACAMMGRMHRAGLCHGRPHPRDILFDGESWGFLDFEEEPEAAMPLASAQARDIWLMFFQVAAAARSGLTAGTAFDAYREAAPAETLAALARLVGFFRPLAVIGEAVARLRRGGDLDRFLKAMGAFRGVRFAPAERRTLEAAPHSDLRPGNRPPDAGTGRNAASSQDHQ